MNTGEYDEMLDNIERKAIGFTSFRTWLNNEFKYRDGNLTIEQLNNYHETDIVHDIIIKTLLNENRLVGINDTIYQYFSSKVVLSTDRGNNLGVNFMNTFRIGDDITHTSPRTFANSGITVHSNGISYPTLPVLPPHSTGTGGLVYTPIDPNSMDSLFGVIEVGGGNNDSLRYTTTVYTDAADCSPTLRGLLVSLEEEIFNYTDTTWSSPLFFNGTATLIIDWKDGSALEIIQNYDWSWVSHDFPNTNWVEHYKPIVKTIFTDLNGDVDTLIDGFDTDGYHFEFVAGISCSYLPLYYPEDIISADGNWMMHTEIWISQGAISSHIGSKTCSYEAGGNAWTPVKSDIWCHIYGRFRDNGCVLKSTKEGSKNGFKKEIQKTKTKYWHHYKFANGEVYSGNYMNKGSYHLEYGYVLNPC